MEAVVLVIHLIIALALIATVLLQRSEGGGLGIGGSGAGGLISVRGQANLLTRATGILAGCFMLTSLVLAIMAGAHTERRSILDAQPVPAQSQPAPQQPTVPLSQ
ncbi:MAG: preprotein translocase subunit SecG [Alphaproteobacteria bacterium]